MSARSAELKRRLLWPATHILRRIVNVLGRSYRFRILHEERLRDLLEDPRPVVICCWHQQVLAAAYFLHEKVHKQGLEMVLMASHSRDGELVARFAKLLKMRVIRGSASRGGQGAIRSLHRALVRDRVSPLVIPDGPRGPIFECKPGAVLLSQFARVEILPLGFAASRSWHLGSWDRMFVPKLRSRVTLSVGALRTVSRELSPEERDTECKWLEELLNELTREAQAAGD